MEERNFCRFLPRRRETPAIHAINIVREYKESGTRDAMVTPALYVMNIVLRGECMIHTPRASVELSAGDVFFCLPSLPYSIEVKSDLEYAYITFLGARSNMLLEKVGANRQSFAFHGVHDALAIWRAALESTEQGAVADLVCESVLLYTFALLGRGRDDDDEALDDTVLRVKKYVDENYSDSEMDLDTLAERFSYSKKYLSAAFKNRFGVGFSEHLRSLRITHACALVEQGFTSVKDIACMCGFADQMYFSKVFKESMGVSPKEYIAKGKER